MHRNWKTTLALLLSALLLLALAACSTGNNSAGNGNTAAPTGEPTAEPTSEPVVLEPSDPTAEPGATATDDPATVTNDANATADDPAATTDDAGASVPNPRVEVASLEELDAALGFNVYVLDADSGYTAEEFTVIDGTVGEILYRNEAGAELCLRTAKGAEDISGVQGATLTDQSTEQVKIQSGSLDDLLVAWLTNDTMACSLTAKGLDQAAFDALIQQLTPQLAPEM